MYDQMGVRWGRGGGHGGHGHGGWGRGGVRVVSSPGVWGGLGNWGGWGGGLGWGGWGGGWPYYGGGYTYPYYGNVYGGYTYPYGYGYGGYYPARPQGTNTAAIRAAYVKWQQVAELARNGAASADDVEDARDQFMKLLFNV